MTKNIYQWSLTTAAILLPILFQLTVIPCFMQNWRGKIKKFVENLIKKANTENRKNECTESLEQSSLIDKREEEDGLIFITKWVAVIELVVFIGITLLIFNEEPALSALNKAKIFGAFLGGWLGIKVLSSHGAWSDKIVGKAHYHTSLIGTLFNVIVGFISGWLLYQAWLV
ncbi:hypothetical protein HY224_01765 [Candidatus Uhrbacteria bacterium]|nr:hypothetical protein [Candidatus Uhrbacteria bacterium]